MGKNLSRVTRKYKNGRKDYPDNLHLGEKEKWRMWSGKFMSGAEIKWYHVLLTGAKKIPAYEADVTKEKYIPALKLLNFKAYTELILTQEDTVLFHTIEAAKTKANKYGDARLVWTKSSGKFEPTTGDSKTRLPKKFAKCKPY